jgi:hypothetical protein
VEGEDLFKAGPEENREDFSASNLHLGWGKVFYGPQKGYPETICRNF